MFKKLDWDRIFNLKIFQITKWLFGAIAIILIVLLIYHSYVSNHEIYKPLIIGDYRGK